MLYLNNFCANKRHQNFKNMNISGFLFLYISSWKKQLFLQHSLSTGTMQDSPRGVPRPDKTQPHLLGATWPPGEKRKPREPWVRGTGSTASLTERGHWPGVLNGSGCLSNEASEDVLIRKEVESTIPCRKGMREPEPCETAGIRVLFIHKNSGFSHWGLTAQHARLSGHWEIKELKGG